MIAADVTLGEGVVVRHPELVNLYGCAVGDETRIGPFVEIQAGAVIGRRCKLSSHTFVCTGVTIEDEVFVGHGVMFTNDRFPGRRPPRAPSRAPRTGSCFRSSSNVERRSAATRRSSPE